jgi:ubiquinone/menaquinone biosynthesis C-methylase UbiE
MSEMYMFNSKLSLLKKVAGESPARCFELPLAVTNLDMKPGEKLLDMGAGESCFGLFMMIHKKVNVTVLDMDGKVMVNKKYLENLGMMTQPVEERFSIIDRPKDEIKEKVYQLQNGRFTIEVCDARKMKFPDSAFDAISFISSIEHIPNNGDLLAIKEASRCLRRGGRMFISVPYSQKYEEGKSHGGHFERKYNYNALLERLVNPSNLNIKSSGFIFDSKTRRLAGILYYGLPSYLRYMHGWTKILLAVSRHISKKDNANRNDAQFAWMLLEKTE